MNDFLTLEPTLYCTDFKAVLLSPRLFFTHMADDREFSVVVKIEQTDHGSTASVAENNHNCMTILILFRSQKFKLYSFLQQKPSVLKLNSWLTDRGNQFTYSRLSDYEEW